MFWGALLIAVSHAPVSAQTRQAVSLELALLVDVSASVNDHEYSLQTAGLAKALRSPRVLRAIETIAPGGVAVCLVQWANQHNQKRVVDWTLLRTAADSLQLADRVQGTARQIHGGHTAVGDALAFALKEIETNRFEGLRRVIDLSGDGRSNDGRSLFATRRDVVARGVIINGLAILNELPLLASYFRDQLIGGTGAFVETALDYEDFAPAMARKLERELLLAPLAFNQGHANRVNTAFLTARWMTPWCSFVWLSGFVM